MNDTDRDLLAQKARGVLRNFRGRSDAVLSCGLVTFDGLVIASELAAEVDPDRFGAMCASLLALSSRASKEVARGQLRQVILDGEHGPMLLHRAGNVGVLAVAAGPSAKLGKLILDAREASRALAELYGEHLA